MLRTNLATRPFYNERVVHLLVGLAAVIVLVITLFNVVKVMELSRHNTELSTRIARDRGETERLNREAGRTRRGIGQTELASSAAATREANVLIDQRTFSWTAFFNQLESTLPPDVMVTSVRPVVDHEATHVTLGVLGRNTDDLEDFMERLEATGAFENVLTRQQDRTEQGLHRLVLDAVYVASPDETPPAAEAPAQEPAMPSDTRPEPPPAAQPKAGAPR